MTRSSSSQTRLERQLRDLFASRFGHAPGTHVLEQLADVVRQSAAGCGFSSLDEYVQLLSVLPSQASTIQALLRLVTDGESYFFRDPSSMDALRHEILPRLIRRASGARRIRVWSAGCSSGEELYSLSMLLHELIPDITSWDISLVGSDLDTGLLARARRARYKTPSLRVTLPADRARYFTPERDGSYVVRSPFRRGVEFVHHNLADAAALPPEPGEFDLILCRSVAVTLDAEARQTLARTFAFALAPHGVWVSGLSDPLPSGPFASRVLPGLVVHQREISISADGLVQIGENARSHAQDPAASASTAVAKVEATDGAVLTPGGLPVLEDHRSEQKTCQPEVPFEDGSASQSPVLEFDARRFDAAVVLEAARTLADQGHTDPAIDLLDRLVEVCPTNTEAYLLRSHLRELLGQTGAAEVDLKRVIHLEPTRGEAYLRMGLLHLREGRRRAALQALRDALLIGDRDDAEKDLEIRKVAALNLMRVLDKAGR